VSDGGGGGGGGGDGGGGQGIHPAFGHRGQELEASMSFMFEILLMTDIWLG
jgi:hypothetical protein